MKSTSTVNKTITLKIDGKSVKTNIGKTVLQVAQKQGIYIPTLCNLESVIPFGGCRICIVKIKNLRGFPTACTTPVAPQMEIITKNEELQNLRREILELILSEHPFTCLVCKDKSECKEFMHTTRKVSVTTGCNFCSTNGNCNLQDLVEYLELKEIRFSIAYRNISPINDNPFYKLDYNLCILCGRCVRVCNDVRHSDVLAFVKRGNLSLVGTAFNESQLEAGCEFCGACVDVCPVGSITEKLGSWAGVPVKSTITTCTYCSVACEMNVNSKGKRIVNVGPEVGQRSDPFQLCVRGKFTPGDIVHHPERVKTPLIKRGDKWIEVTWKEAIKFIASSLEKYRGNQFSIIGSAQDTLENNYVLQKFSRKVMRSNNIDTFDSFQNRALMEKIHDYYNEYPPPEIDKISQTETVFLVGSDASITEPIVELNIRKANNNGKNVIFANSNYNRTSNFANKSIIYKPGEENSFLLILLAVMLQSKKSNKTKKLLKYFENFDIDKAAKKCGIDLKDIKIIAKDINNSNETIIIVGDTLLRSPEWENIFNVLYNIPMILENPNNCRIVFLLGEGNRYGAMQVGLNPDYLPGFEKIKNDSNIKKWSNNWNVKLSNVKGLSCNEIVESIDKNGTTALFLIGNIPADPRLKNLKFLIQQNLFLTDTSKYANIFIPMTHFCEAGGHIVNLERKLKKLTPVINTEGEGKSPWEAVTLISNSMLELGIDYNNEDEVFSEIESLIDLSHPVSNKKVHNIKPV